MHRRKIWFAVPLQNHTVNKCVLLKCVPFDSQQWECGVEVGGHGPASGRTNYFPEIFFNNLFPQLIIAFPQDNKLFRQIIYPGKITRFHRLENMSKINSFPWIDKINLACSLHASVDSILASDFQYYQHRRTILNTLQ